MYHFFVPAENISAEEIVIGGGDFNHIKNVLRMKPGEKIVVNDGNGASYCCRIREFVGESVVAEIEKGQLESTELPVRVVLFQGLPKSDKMELIIQKAVELGANEVVPVEMTRCVVKLDEKKKKSKLTRWQAIAEGAAKQSGRTVVTEVKNIMSFDKALEYAQGLDMLLVPYECAESVAKFQEKLSSLKSGMSVGIFIGPEGGYEEFEIEKAKEHGGEIVSLGKRILRTETAAVAALAICMFNIELNL